jgi:predicted enzyme related to lactoylglutathione lyase
MSVAPVTIIDMGLTFSGVVVDSTDPARAAEFWAAALGWSGRESGERGEEIISPGEGEAGYGPPSIVFQPVPEAKTVKNRVHLDLYSPDQAVDVARLEALGATRVDVGQGEERSFVVLADVEGNEFCVLSEW